MTRNVRYLILFIIDANTPEIVRRNDKMIHSLVS
nr:MAG TPA: hypothetical protein [Caudoviricetes sp.]